MTVPSRYRGQPVSEGIGLGEIYHGDPRPAETNGHRRPATEDEVRAAFAAVARDRAALAGQLRDRGQDLQAGIVDIAALIAACWSWPWSRRRAARAARSRATAAKAACTSSSVAARRCPFSLVGDGSP